MKAKRNDHEQALLAHSLGASRIVKVKDGRARGPLEWAEMGQTLQQRLVSRGGRPSDPHWDTKRLVPFHRRTWNRLTRKARSMSAHGRKVGPAQLAAILIEQNI